MKKSIHRKVKESFEAYPKQIRHEWVLVWPGQCVSFNNYFIQKLINFFFQKRFKAFLSHIGPQKQPVVSTRIIL